MGPSRGTVRVVIACVAVAVWACGSTNPSGGGVDAATDAPGDGMAPDAGKDAGPRCDPSKPFGAPVPVAELNTAANDLFARLTHDELTVYFERFPSADAGVPGGTGGGDLFVASRPSATASFGQPISLSSLNTAGNQFDPTPTGDDLTLYFASTRSGGAGVADLWAATRTDTAAAFGSVVNLGTLDTPAQEHTPYAMADGLTLYFTREAASVDLLRATRTSSTSFTVDTSGIFAAINGASANLAPAVLPDELTIYFASDRSGSKGPLDIWKATRSSKSDAFGSVVNVSELNTTGTDVPTWISDDGCRMYLYDDSAGSSDIYVATKPAN